MCYVLFSRCVMQNNTPLATKYLYETDFHGISCWNIFLKHFRYSIYPFILFIFLLSILYLTHSCVHTCRLKFCFGILSITTKDKNVLGTKMFLTCHLQGLCVTDFLLSSRWIANLLSCSYCFYNHDFCQLRNIFWRDEPLFSIGWTHMTWVTVVQPSPWETLRTKQNFNAMRPNFIM